MEHRHQPPLSDEPSPAQIRAALARLIADLPPEGRTRLESLLKEWVDGPLWRPLAPPTGKGDEEQDHHHQEAPHGRPRPG
jgi:hypothetical protein